jgi:hypothetical protein
VALLFGVASLKTRYTHVSHRPLGYECNLTRNFSELREQG